VEKTANSATTTGEANFSRREVGEILPPSSLPLLQPRAPMGSDGGTLPSAGLTPGSPSKEGSGRGREEEGAEVAVVQECAGDQGRRGAPVPVGGVPPRGVGSPRGWWFLKWRDAGRGGEVSNTFFTDGGGGLGLPSETLTNAKKSPKDCLPESAVFFSPHRGFGVILVGAVEKPNQIYIMKCEQGLPGQRKGQNGGNLDKNVTGALLGNITVISIPTLY